MGTLSEHLSGWSSFYVFSVSLVYNYWAAMKHNEKPDMLPNKWRKHAHQRVERHREREKQKLSSPRFILRTSCALIRKDHPCSPSPIPTPPFFLNWGKKELTQTHNLSAFSWVLTTIPKPSGSNFNTAKQASQKEHYCKPTPSICY